MITFNGIHCSTFGLKAKVIRPLHPGYSDNYTEIPGRAGSILFPGKPQDRIITVEFGFMPGSRALFREKVWEISAWLSTSDRVALVFDDEPGKTYMGKIEGEIDLEQAYLLGQFKVDFRCAPFAYGTLVSANFVGDALTVANAGTYEAEPLFTSTFTATATEWKVALGDYYMRVENDFAIGDVLVVNHSTGLVSLNGSRAMDLLDWQNSNFFTLAPGANTLAVTPTGKCGTLLQYTPMWL